MSVARCAGYAGVPMRSRELTDSRRCFRPRENQQHCEQPQRAQ
jgi:hypothetical protein